MDRRNYGSMAATAAVVEDDADPDSEEEEAGFRVVLEKPVGKETNYIYFYLFFS